MPIRAPAPASATFSRKTCRHIGHFPWLASDEIQSLMQCMWKQCVQAPMTVALSVRDFALHGRANEGTDGGSH